MKTNLKLLFSVLFLIAAVLPVFAVFPGNCLNFESGDYVQGTGIPTSFSSGVTIEAWVNHSSLSPNIQRYFTVLGENMVLRMDESRVDFYIKASSGVQYRIRPATLLVTGQWYHVAGTYDGTTMKLYVNGTLVGTTTTTGGIYPIGGTYNIGNGTEPMIGKIDDVRLWNVARSQAQIADNRFHELTGTETGLRSYWKFDESSENIAYDSCNHSNGTLMNMSDTNWVASTIPLVGESGTISANTTWSASTVMVFGDVTVVNGVTLTINPGVTVYIAPDKKLIINGNLIAEGTNTNRITFTENSPGAGWGGLLFSSYSAPAGTQSSMNFCIVEHGIGTPYGGNIEVDRYPFLELENCIIRYGVSPLYGGGLECYNSTVRVTNCLFNNNQANSGGAIHISGSSDFKMTNCTVADNTTYFAGAIFTFLSPLTPVQPVIRNCVFWNNGNSPILAYHTSPSINDLQYCNVQGGYPGTGNINHDPNFSGEAGSPYNISNSSYCVNAGINVTDGLPLSATDLNGNPRIFAQDNPIHDKVDMGAYEHQGYLAPSSFSASDGDNNYPGYVQLLWDFNLSYFPAVTGFRILRDGSDLSTVSGQVRSYQDNNAVPGTIYSYQVLANYDTSSGNSISASSLEDCGYIKPNGIISGRIQTTNNNPVVGVKLTLSPSVGKCIQFNAGNNSSISIAYPGVDLKQDFTMELWVKTLDSNVNLLDSVNHHLKIVGGDLVYTDGSHTLTQQNLAIAVNDGSWHHIAVVNNVSTNTVKMYLDSSIVAEDTGYHFANNYYLGSFVVPTGFTGFLDDIRLWTVVRDSSQVVEVMNIVVPSNSTGLQGYWAMNEGAGTMLFDATNNAHNAVASNCTWSSNDAGMALGGVTNVWGDYVISQIPYGTSTTFTVTPSKPGHIFQPETKIATLSSSNIAAGNVDFTDNSMIPISGKVTFYGTTIPVVNASIWLNGVRAIPPVVTDSTGYYVMEVEHGTSCIVSIKFNDHVFTGNGNLGVVTYPQANVNFTDSFQTQLCVQVVGGRQSFPIGNFKITAKPVNDAYAYEKIFNADNSADWATGQVVIPYLPPLNYNITIAPILNYDPFNLAVNTGFTKLKNIDLSNADAAGDTLRFEWRAPLQVEVAWDPALQMKYMTSDTLHEYGFYVMQQNVWQEAVVKAMENYNYGSYTDHILPMPNCDIAITNNVGAITDSTTSFNGAESFTYRFAPYLPNLLDGGNRPYQKNLQIAVTDPATSRTAGNITWILTEGECPQQSTYASTSPEIPILVLHDPPGDGSYASFNQSSSHSFTMGVSYGSEETSGSQVKCSLGLDIAFETGIMFSVETNLDFVADLNLGFQSSSTSVSDTTIVTTITTTEEYQTSSQDMLIGQASDLYVGGAVNLVWGLTKTLVWQDSSNSVELGERLMVVPQGFGTWYIYTENQIINTVIPNLIAINEPEDAARWQSFVDANTQNINNAVANENHHGNISFNAGAGYLFSETNSTETETTYSFETTVDESCDTEFGAYVNGLGGTAGFGFATSLTIGKSLTESTQTETTISYVLADDDETSNLNELADYYSVDIKKDPMYGTPVFSVVGGASSNPWEPNTRPRDGVSFSANTNTSTGLLEGQQAVFLLNLGNNTQNNEARRYYLSMHHESNPGGATILINGLPLIDRMAFDIEPGTSVDAIMTVIQGPVAYSYPDLTLEFYAEGDRGNDGPEGYYFWQTQSFDVIWETPYSRVSIASPGEEWKINQASDNSLAITLTSYNITKPRFSHLILEYKRPSAVTWSQGFVLTYADLLTHPVYIIAPWDVSALADGVYQIRAGAADSLGVRYYTDYITGFIDRSSPVVWGLPQPADGVLHLGDVISLTFTEDIDPISLASASISVRIPRTNMDVDKNVQVNGSSVSIVPLISNYWLENETVTVSVSGLKDLCGNSMAGLPVEWEFFVNANPVAWVQPKLEMIKPLGQAMQISTYLNNSGGQTSSFSITGLPDWLTVDCSSGTLLPLGMQTLVFTVSNQLGYGTFRDTVYASIPGLGIEPLIFEINVLANPPVWATTQLDNFEYSMTITGQLQLEGETSSDTNDIIAAFVLDNNADYVCRGYANVQSVPYLPGVYQFFLTVNSDIEDGEELFFRVWDSSTSKEHFGITEEYVFMSGAVYGTPLSPVTIHVSPHLIRSIPCRSGWNWVSVNLVNPVAMDVNTLLSSITPTSNDIVKSQIAYSQYQTGMGWVGSMGNISTTSMVKLKLSNPDLLELTGALENPVTTPVTHGAGWNWIGYLPHVSISVNQALANIAAPVTGDLVKSQSGYSQYMEGHGWFGSMLFMNPGMGYMLHTANSGTMYYPDYQIPREGIIDSYADRVREIRYPAGWNLDPLTYEYTSCLTTVVKQNGLTLNQANLVLAAFYGNECRGVAIPVLVQDQWTFFLTQYSNIQNQTLCYKLFNSDSEEITELLDTLPFINNQVLGNPLNPHILNCPLAELGIPQNLSLQITDGQLTLSWDAVSGAASYLVLTADSPSEDFTDISSLGYFERAATSSGFANAGKVEFQKPDANRNRISWTCDVPLSSRKFYHIKASTTPR